jgi:tetratricopeptide (TPR) repeat protein
MVQVEAGNSVQDIYCKGLDCLKAGEYPAALNYFNQALVLEPNNVNIWDKHSITLRELGRYYEADVSKSKVHKLYYCQNKSPQEEQGLINSDSAPIAITKEPIDALPKELVVDTTYQASYWIEVANRAYQNGDFASEADAYMQALEIQPKDHRSWYNLGIALRNLKVYAMAIDAYENALKIAPDFHLAWNGLGNAYRDLREYEKALNAYNRAISIDPEFHYAWHGLGNTLRAKGEYVAAIKVYEKAIRIAPQYHLSWYGLGNAFRDLGCHRQAIFAYETVIKITPSFWRAWDGKGTAMISLGNYDEAIDTWRSGIDTLETYLPLNHEGCGELYHQLAYYQYLQGRREGNSLPYWLEARDNYSRALYHLEQTNLSDRYQKILQEYNRTKNLCKNTQQSILKVS